MLLKSSFGASYFFTNWLFLRGLALTYFFAFLSLSSQVLGLLGSNGILPAADFLKILAAHLGKVGYLICPNIFWLNSSDPALFLACLAGVLFSLLALFGVFTGLSFLFLWILYLSLVNIGQDFLSFQWDALLLETGFLAIFLAPWQYLECPWIIKLGKFRLTPAKISPSTSFLWLTRWLLFRLMFESGFVKLASGDSNWNNLGALDFHYFTQPLPMPLAWLAAQLPHWFNAFSVLMVFVIELIIPFFIFGGRRLRIIAAFALLVLQIIIVLTGNYAYFNLLTIVLCISLFDDQFIKDSLSKTLFVQNKLWRAFIYNLNNSVAAKDLNKLQNTVLILAATFVALISVSTLEQPLSGLLPVPSFLQTLHDFSSPYFIANTYGLFAVMTTKRLEIIVEGSNDGKAWQEYQFKYKPGNLSKVLPVVAPMQPRLDWQMWFAALGDPACCHWFMKFLLRLMQGHKEVLDLLAINPFPTKPPKYLRAKLYDYHFTNFMERQRSNNWWKRDFVRECVPPIGLDNSSAKLD